MPRGVRLQLRRWIARRERWRRSHVWPILPGSERPPEGWAGWPEGKEFALVLTHDVEGQQGLERCLQLMETEKKLGFRSSFNFIPEGRDPVPESIRARLTQEGFEIGVHDLNHDGKLYKGRLDFTRKAARINRYLKEWGAVGYRSGFMLHNLDWHHDLDIQYDASTFDTDPFEPQPDAVGTVFPFWKASPNGSGYVELPYTLPQDSTLFLLFGERSPALWMEKLDWIASHGAMALVNVHPDYIQFPGEEASDRTFPLEYYEEFLRYARQRYGSGMWNALPREVAAHIAPLRPAPPPPPAERARKTIWIDLDNTPHVPLFAPVVRELTRRGYDVSLTARDAFQVCELAEKKRLRCLKIGRHHGKNKLRKVTGLFFRAAQLAPFAWTSKPVIGLSHGSRSQILLCNFLRIPTVLMADYEFAKYPPMMRPTWEMAPEVIPDKALSCASQNIRKYPGIKEDIYVPDFSPNPAFRGELGIGKDEILAVVRPPATEAHYHNPEAEGLFARFMDRACRTENVRVVLLPRNKRQAEVLRAEHAQWFEGNRTIIPKGAVDGLDLIWHSDLVVSGGGTMNREAAALHVPVYSVFRGKIGAVDHQLQKEGRLMLIENAAQVDAIALTRRAVAGTNGTGKPLALEKVVNNVISIVEHHLGAPRA